MVSGSGEDERVYFHPEEYFRPRVEKLWAEQAAFLRKLLPGADVQHVGSTAVPGSLTKGDLDIQVRVTEGDFDNAVAALAEHFARNTLSTPQEGFTAFANSQADPPLGIQLTTIDGDLDIFWRFREVLFARRDLQWAFEKLKRSYEGRPMSEYRAAKSAFFHSLRQTPEFRKLWHKDRKTLPDL
jgi:GrpB-like predicted nucleotidyltransferase (UPF0157 family)